MAGIAAGIVVLGSALAVLVALPELGVLPPSPALSATPSAVAPSATPGQTARPTTAPPSSPEVGLHPGQLAPPLEVDRLDGGTINLAALRGQAVWLNFLGSWCPPCYDEMPLMEGYWTRLSAQGLVVVGVDVKETREVAQAFVDQVGVSFPVGVDPTSTTQQYWGAYVMPVHFWIDREGIIRAFAFGGIGPPQMEDGIRSILPEANLPTAAP